MQAATLAGIEAGLIQSAHDCSDGGLAVALAECAIWSNIGLRGEAALPADAQADALTTLAALYGEAPSRILVSVAADRYAELEALASTHGVPLTRLGVSGGDRLTFAGGLDAPVDELRAAWRGGLAAALGASDAEQVAEALGRQG